jgi:hypothetical protein
MGRDTNAGHVVCGRTVDEEVAAEVPEPARICRGIAAEVLEPARICRGTIGSGKKINLQEPAQIKATREQIELPLKSLRAEKMAVEAKIIQAPTDRGLLQKLREVDDQIARGNIELNDEVEMKLTEDEKAHSNAWRSHQEKTGSINKAGVRSTLSTWPVHPSAG